MASLGIWGLDGVIHSQLGIWQEVHLDTRAVFAALGLTGLATLGFCVTPAFQVASPRLYRIITSGSRVVGGGSHGVRKLLLIGQVAMVTTLLLVAGLLVRSYRYLDGLDPGFDPSGVLTVQFSLDHAGYADARNVESLFGESLDAIRRIRGVSAAAVTLTLPYERALNVPFQLASEDDYRLTNLVYVTPGFFSTLEIPLLQGRVLQGSDRAGEPSIAMANQAFVEAYFRDTEVLGSSANVVCCGVDRLTIVGVVGNVQQSAGWGGTLQPVWETPTLYVPAAQLSSDFFRLAHVPFSPSWLVRGSAELAPQVTQVFRQVAPDLALARVAPLEEVMDLAFSWQRLEAAFLITVAAFALLLAAVGLYGIVAHEVQERRGEIGLRLALGASPRRAVLATAAKGLTLTLYGVALGSVLGLGLARVLMGRLIFGLRAHDPTTLGTVLLIMTIICSVASLLPAARVARIDPADVLKAA